MMIREIIPQDLSGLLELYTHLHDNEIPPIDHALAQLWEEIMNDENHHILVAEVDNKLVSSCVLIIVPNLTHEQRPYALVENVITAPQYRQKGYAAQVLRFAKKIACDHHCYKMMLMTGSKKDSTFRFYAHAGYNSSDKTAFVQWLDL